MNDVKLKLIKRKVDVDRKSMYGLDLITLICTLVIGSSLVSVGCVLTFMHHWSWLCMLLSGVYTIVMGIYTFVQLRAFGTQAGTGWYDMIHEWYGVFGFVWSIINNIFSFTIYIMVPWMKGDYVFIRRIGWIFEFETNRDAWTTKMFWGKRVAARAAGCFVVYIDEYKNNSPTRMHEWFHCWQSFAFGVFFPVIYSAHSAYLYFTKKDPYKQNVMELGAYGTNLSYLGSDFQVLFLNGLKEQILLDVNEALQNSEDGSEEDPVDAAKRVANGSIIRHLAKHEIKLPISFDSTSIDGDLNNHRIVIVNDIQATDVIKNDIVLEMYSAVLIDFD